MSSVDARQELIDPPGTGRVFEQAVRAGLADCAPAGRVRLDALARWLQDIAFADIEDAGLTGRSVWVVRRTRLRVERFPRFGSRLTVRTFCSGLGRMWAERRTTIAGDSGPAVEAAALWVNLDPVARRPARLDEEALSIFRDSAGDRQVNARLRHPDPDPGAEASGWRFRATELDLAGHVNNSAYWQPLEDELVRGEEPARIDAEIEFQAPAQPGEKRVLRSAGQWWIVGAGGELHASLQFAL